MVRVRGRVSALEHRVGDLAHDLGERHAPRGYLLSDEGEVGL